MGEILEIASNKRYRFQGKALDVGTQQLAGGITILMEGCMMEKRLVIALVEGLIDAMAPE